MTWLECKLDSDYEINDTYPYPIRSKKTKYIISESERFEGYIQCFMNRKQYYKHRIIAEQFIPNPNKYRFVLHLDYDRKNNHLDNLAWSETWRHI